jgi:hypothetical protein
MTPTPAWRLQYDRDARTRTTLDHRDGELDEVVIGHWLHAERLGDGQWFVSVGPHRFWLEAKRDGSAVVTMHEQDERRGKR